MAIKMKIDGLANSLPTKRLKNLSIWVYEIIIMTMDIIHRVAAYKMLATTSPICLCWLAIFTVAPLTSVRKTPFILIAIKNTTMSAESAMVASANALISGERIGVTKVTAEFATKTTKEMIATLLINSHRARLTSTKLGD